MYIYIQTIFLDKNLLDLTTETRVFLKNFIDFLRLTWSWIRIQGAKPMRIRILILVRFFVGYFCPPGSGSRSGFETVKINLSLVEQACDVAGIRWPPCFRGAPASFAGYFCPPGSGSNPDPDSKQWNSTSVLLNKLATSQEVDDLLVLEEFPLLLWFFFVLLNPDPIQIRIRNSEIQP